MLYLEAGDNLINLSNSQVVSLFQKSIIIDKIIIEFKGLVDARCCYLEILDKTRRGVDDIIEAVGWVKFLHRKED